jgi:hypothetical protein
MIKEKPGLPLKVIELGIQDKVYEAMMSPSFSVEALTRSLNSQGIIITAQSIRKFIRKTKDAQKELIKTDLNTAYEIKKLTMDYTKEIKDILTEVKEIKNTALTERDLATVNQMIGRLFQGIELIAKLTGDIKPSGSVDINIVYNEINNAIEKDMKDVRSKLFNSEVFDIDAEVIEEDKKEEEKIKEEVE